MGEKADFQCQDCSNEFSIDDYTEGKPVTCPNCGSDDCDRFKVEYEDYGEIG